MRLVQENKETLIQEWFNKVDKKITSGAIAKQFILEELDAASDGNDESKEFVINSGFSEIDYKGAMNDEKSYDEVDGAGGPQQTLIFECQFPLLELYDINWLVEVRLQVVDRIMKKYSLGKYSYKNIRLIIKGINSGNYSFIDKFKNSLMKDSLEFMKLDDTKYYNQLTQSYIEINEDTITFNVPGKTTNIYSILSRDNLLDEVLIITEGKTDWKHLKKSLRKFHKQGLYLNLNIKFEEYEDIDMGDAELDSMVRTYSKKEQDRKYIFIFDRDNKKFIDKYGMHEFNNHGNNVYSFCIPKIGDEFDEICIEFYYSINDLVTEDKNGRRLFIGDEFHGGGNGDSKCGRYITEKRNVKALDIVDRDKKVFLKDDTDKENNIALSKNDFANNIINNIERFSNFDIENFKLIFDVIEEIINEDLRT